MDDKVLNAALAGLLHDVGKFSQRAEISSSRVWDDEAEKEYKYQHAVFSGDFAEKYLPTKFKPLSPPAYHHAPKSDFDRLIQLADWLSAYERNVDRQKHPKQLLSIFSRVSLKEEGQAHILDRKNWQYFSLRPLALKEDTVFAKEMIERDDVASFYKALWDGEERKAPWRGFVKEAKDLQASHESSPDPETYLESMMGLMQRYTWCIPSAYYKDVPDVSLYDHSRSVAAIAACLAEFEPTRIAEIAGAVGRDIADKAMDEDKKALSEPIALLVGGDISGVQDYIYTLTSKKAAQTLRGRSFYLQLLTEAILRYVLRKLRLPYTNVIYSGGGHFYLLASMSAKKELPNIQKYITETLLDHHGAALYLAFGYAEVPTIGFKIGNFPKHWKAMHDDLARAKQQRYQELGDKLYESVFKPQEHGGNREDTCSVCGEEREHTTKIPADDEDGRICPLCQSFFEQIGSKLPQADYVLLGLGEPQRENKARGKAFDVLRAFGVDVVFNPDYQFSNSVERVVAWALGDTDERVVVKGKPTAQVARYTVNRVPMVKDSQEAAEINKRLSESDRKRDPAKMGENKTFTHLQAQSRDGFERLGVLRMDVDNLGDLFKDGFYERDEKGNVIKNDDGKPKSIATLSRISALSFQMSLFFEGWVKRLCEKDEYDNLIYAVYAGGDDVFLIGPWDKMPTLASHIANDFKQYVGGNPDVHLSGGLAFIGGKYPVYQAADDAHDVLESAKDLDGKDAFGFLGEAWKWSEFSEVSDKFYRLIKIVGKDGLDGPQALLQVLRRLGSDETERHDTEKKKRRVKLAAMHDKPKEREAEKKKPIRPLWGPWMWQGAYRLKRMAKQYEKHKDLFDALELIHKELSDKNYANIRQWGIAARWAQLWVRERGDRGDD